jgi:hypothetical protein
MFAVRTSEKDPASSVINSTVSEVFLQNHASHIKAATCGGYMGYPPRNWLFYLFSYMVL